MGERITGRRPIFALVGRREYVTFAACFDVYHEREDPDYDDYDDYDYGRLLRGSRLDSFGPTPRQRGVFL